MPSPRRINPVSADTPVRSSALQLGHALACYVMLLTACGGSDGGEVRAPVDEGGYAIEYQCDGCSVMVESPIDFTAEQLPGMTPGSEIEIDPNSEQLRFAYAPTDASGEVRLFERAQDSARSLTRFGAGPGELGSISALTWGGPDTLIIFGPARYSVLDIGSGDLTHDDFPERLSTLRVAGNGNGRVLVNNHRPTGHRFLAFDADGRDVVRFGDFNESPDREAERAGTAIQNVVITAEGVMLTSPLSRVWKLTQWDRAGHVLRDFLEPEWLTVLTPDEYDKAEAAGDTALLRQVTPVNSLGLIDERLAMLFARVPAAAPFDRGIPGVESFNGMLEILDLSTGERVATVRFRGLSRHLSVGGWVPITATDSSGFISAEFYRVRVDRAEVLN